MSGPDADDLGERLISRAPVVVRRRVAWGDCDPAQVVYTPRFADYGASAVDWFWRVVLPPGGPSLVSEGLMSPIKHMEFTFEHVLRPGDLFDMTVYLTAIRTRTLDLMIKATGIDGTPRFSASFSPILVSTRTFTSAAIPASLRRPLEAYHERFSGVRTETPAP
jgi:acyl-CoA thioesterase FadM